MVIMLNLINLITILNDFLYKKCKKIQENYYDVVELYNAIKERNNGKKILSLYICTVTILKLLYTKFILKKSRTKLVNKNTYEINYALNDRKYKMHIYPITGPSMIMKIINENGDDITNIVLPYMGPEQNWHGKNFSPSFFDCKVLTFERFDGEKFSI